MARNKWRQPADSLRATAHILLCTLGAAVPAIAQVAPEGLPPAVAPPAPAPAPAIPALRPRIVEIPGLAGAGWLFTPRVGLVETATNNAGQAIGSLAKRDWVTEFTPGFRLQNIGAQSALLLDWQTRLARYKNEPRLNNSTQQLNAQFNFQPVEKFFFVDSLAAINQQNRSPFAIALANDALTPDDAFKNRVDTRTYRISPYVRGHIHDFARYQVRFNETEVRTDENAIPSTRLRELVGKIFSANPGAKIGWSGEFNLLQINNATVVRLNDNRIRGSLIYALTDQFRVTGSFGRDATDFAVASAAIGRRSNNIYGAGFEWSPSARTQVAALREHRFFGEGYVMQFSHRTPRTSWRVSATRDVTALPQQLAAVDPGTVYNALHDLLTSAIPDPTARAEAARTRLQQVGIAPNAALGGGFLTTRPYLSTSRNATVALLGIRNTITLTYSQRDQLSVGPAIVRGNTLATSEDVRQKVVNAAWAYRLTPIMTLTLQGSRLETEGLNDSGRRSRQTLQSLVLSRPLSAKANISFGLRNTDFKSTVVRSYSERVLFGALNYRF
jgi:uncharacterized protein (PEP-CTERM system associated)